MVTDTDPGWPATGAKNEMIEPRPGCSWSRSARSDASTVSVRRRTVSRPSGVSTSPSSDETMICSTEPDDSSPKRSPMRLDASNSGASGANPSLPPAITCWGTNEPSTTVTTRTTAMTAAGARSTARLRNDTRLFTESPRRCVRWPHGIAMPAASWNRRTSGPRRRSTGCLMSDV